MFFQKDDNNGPGPLGERKQSHFHGNSGILLRQVLQRVGRVLFPRNSLVHHMVPDFAVLQGSCVFMFFSYSNVENLVIQPSLTVRNARQCALHIHQEKRNMLITDAFCHMSLHGTNQSYNFLNSFTSSILLE